MNIETIKPTIAGMTHKDWGLIQDAKENGNSRSYIEKLIKDAETKSCREWLQSLADIRAAESMANHKEEYHNQSL